MKTNTFVPQRSTLSINTLYTLSGVLQGNAYCYHFAITQKSKTTVILNGQNANTNFALYLMQDDGLGNVTVIGYSDNAGNADEAITVVTNPGNYYWYMEANASDGSAINFGAAVSTPVDNYEPNDTPATASALPDKINTVIGNSDSASDYDYYYFTAVRGQKVRMQLSGVTAGTSNKWIMEVYSGGSWLAQSNDSWIDVTACRQIRLFYWAFAPIPAPPGAPPRSIACTSVQHR